MSTSSVSVITQRPVLLWIARVSAILMFGFFSLFAVGEGLPQLLRLPLPVQLEFAALALVFIGYAVGWRHPVAGGTLALLGVAGFNVVEIAVNGKPAGPYFLLFGIPGLLYLNASYWANKRGASNTRGA
jgi:hypothetical protein